MTDQKSLPEEQLHNVSYWYYLGWRWWIWWWLVRRQARSLHCRCHSPSDAVRAHARVTVHYELRQLHHLGFPSPLLLTSPLDTITCPHCDRRMTTEVTWPPTETLMDNQRRHKRVIVAAIGALLYYLFSSGGRWTVRQIFVAVATKNTRNVGWGL